MVGGGYNQITTFVWELKVHFIFSGQSYVNYVYKTVNNILIYNIVNYGRLYVYYHIWIIKIGYMDLSMVFYPLI